MSAAGWYGAVSLDIEACGEVVLSIGACVFNPDGPEIVSEFYGVPSVAEQLAAGLKMDAGAFLWWLKQSAPARNAITEPEQKGAAVVLNDLRAWWPARDAKCWCYPTSYDLPVLARMFSAFGVRPPWAWKETMDARTLWKLAMEADPTMAKIESESGVVEHSALDDAKQQAGWIVRYRAAVRRGLSPNGGR